MGGPAARRVAPLRTVAREWGRIGVVGFGGPPAHVTLLRQLCVERRGWMGERAFADANAATQLLPGPASTQLAIHCAGVVGGRAGALVGGLCFVLPAVLAVLALSALLLGDGPPAWALGAGLGAGAAVPAVALKAGVDLLRPAVGGPGTARRLLYALAAGLAAALAGPWVVLVLLAAGALEATRRDRARGAPAVEAAGRGGAARRAIDAGEAADQDRARRASFAPGVLLAAVAGGGGLGALAWTALKVGALSYGGGFVIIPLMQADATGHGWMTDRQFLDAVALGQITPGPVVATVVAVGFAAHGVLGALLAAAVAFGPSFALVGLGGDRFERLREHPRASRFLAGAGPAAAGAVLGATVPLAQGLAHPWQGGVLLAAAVALLVLRRGVVGVLLLAGLVGVLVG